MLERVQGCLLGQLAGDTLGGLVKFQTPEQIRREYPDGVRELADGAGREQKWTYSEEAVREAFVNALVHRDYPLSGTTVELSIYEDRLEVISPGRLDLI
jgi:ATP-dependent DNA helicase RecG